MVCGTHGPTFKQVHDAISDRVVRVVVLKKSWGLRATFLVPRPTMTHRAAREEAPKARWCRMAHGTVQLTAHSRLHIMDVARAVS